MADNKPQTDYSSNSVKKKKSEETPERVELKPITTGKLQKKSLGSKFKETFAGDSAESVGQYVFFDVIVPRTKDLLFDMVSQGVERLLFGSSSPRTRRSGSPLTQGRTDYRGISNNSNQPERRQPSQQSRANHQFEDILIPSRGEGERVLDTLREQIDAYESATVADLYNCVGITAEHTDLKWGWTNLDDAVLRPARGGGYILDLPSAEAL